MRNIVLVTLDSLRADHCGFMGHSRAITPTLDAMSRDGLVFENAIAPGPSTPESMPAVLTGAHPLDDDTSCPSVLTGRRERLRRHMTARTTLAERLRARGYATAGFSPNPYTSSYFGFGAGFDHYEDFIDGSRRQLYTSVLDGVFAGTTLAAVFPARVALNWAKREEVFKPWEAFYDEIREWVRGVEKPYFLWVLLMDTHDPYLVPNSHRTQSRRATYHANWRLWRQGHEPPFDPRTHDRLVRAYDDAVCYADRFLARLRRDLSATDPVLAVHADHGEAFGEHGTYGHHQRLYEENIHVPLVIDGVPSRTVERPVSLETVPDFLCALAEGREPRLPTGPARTRTLDGERMALRGNHWKYVSGPDGDVLYDLAADPGEHAACDRPKLREGCRRLAGRWTDARTEQRRIATAAEVVVE